MSKKPKTKFYTPVTLSDYRRIMLKVRDHRSNYFIPKVNYALNKTLRQHKRLVGIELNPGPQHDRLTRLRRLKNGGPYLGLKDSHGHIFDENNRAIVPETWPEFVTRKVVSPLPLAEMYLRQRKQFRDEAQHRQPDFTMPPLPDDSDSLPLEPPPLVRSTPVRPVTPHNSPSKFLTRKRFSPTSIANREMHASNGNILPVGEVLVMSKKNKNKNKSDKNKNGKGKPVWRPKRNAPVAKFGRNGGSIVKPPPPRNILTGLSMTTLAPRHQVDRFSANGCRAHGQVLLGELNLAASTTYATGTILAKIGLIHSTFTGSLLDLEFNKWIHWKPKTLRVHYVPNLGSAAPGQYMHFISSDPGTDYSASGITMINSMAAENSSQVGAIAAPGSTLSRVHTKLWTDPDTQYTSSATGIVSFADVRTTTAGDYYFALVTPYVTTAAVTIGSIWLEYEIEFSQPKVQDNLVFVGRATTRTSGGGLTIGSGSSTVLLSDTTLTNYGEYQLAHKVARSSSGRIQLPPGEYICTGILVTNALTLGGYRLSMGTGAPTDAQNPLRGSEPVGSTATAQTVPAAANDNANLRYHDGTSLISATGRSAYSVTSLLSIPATNVFRSSTYNVLPTLHNTSNITINVHAFQFMIVSVGASASSQFQLLPNLVNSLALQEERSRNERSSEFCTISQSDTDDDPVPVNLTRSTLLNILAR